MGQILTLWTIRLALGCYVLALVLLRLDGGRQRWANHARWAWTAACGLLVLHVLCAFQFYHHWSAAEAYTDTARKTAQTLGPGWSWGGGGGGGIYFNYLLILLWCCDVAWWWSVPTVPPSRPRLVEWVWQGFLAFMVFNATIVFADGVIRWISVAVCLGLGGLGALTRNVQASGQR